MRPRNPSASAEIKVLGVIGDELTGISYVRFFQPFRHLTSRGFCLTTLGSRLDLYRGKNGYAPSASLLEGVSLLVFPQLVAALSAPDGSPIDLVPQLCRQARQRGTPIIYSVDDALDDAEPTNPAFDMIAEARANTHQILEHCSGVIVTTPALRSHMEMNARTQGKPIFTIPNAVDLQDWAPRPNRLDRLRVGWAGSSSHIGDLRLVLPALRELQRRIDFDLILMGIIDTTIPEQLRRISMLSGELSEAQQRTASDFVRLARELEGIRFRHVPFLPTSEFVRALPALDLDIGLCPLRDTPFNRRKSALKFYEYAATGSLSVASDVPPYRGEVSVLAGPSTDEWIQALEPLLADANLRARETALQVAYVRDNHTVHHHLDAWDRCLTNFLAMAGPGPR